MCDARRTARTVLTSPHRTPYRAHLAAAPPQEAEFEQKQQAMLKAEMARKDALFEQKQQQRERQQQQLGQQQRQKQQQKQQQKHQRRASVAAGGGRILASAAGGAGGDGVRSAHLSMVSGFMEEARNGGSGSGGVPSSMSSASGVSASSAAAAPRCGGKHCQLPATVGCDTCGALCLGCS